MNELKRYAITYKKSHRSYLGSAVYSGHTSEHTEVIMALNEEEAKRIANDKFGSNNIINIRRD